MDRHRKPEAAPTSMTEPEDEPLYIVWSPLIGYVVLLPTRRREATSTDPSPQRRMKREDQRAHRRVSGWIETILRSLRNTRVSSSRQDRAAMTALAEREHTDGQAE